LCNAEVRIENDNPKLKELIKSPIWNESHYANQIKKGINVYTKKYSSKINTSNLLESSKKVMVGDSSFQNGGIEIKGDEYVKIGSFCSFGKNLKIITSNHDTNYPSSQGYFYKKHFNKAHPGELNNSPNIERTKGPIIIGNDVWIGDDVKILSGVTIGDGVCIAAGTIVTNSIKDYEVHAGIPNKKIKDRFNSEAKTFLKTCKWWEWPDKKIQKNKEFFETNLNTAIIKEINIEKE
jgi:acetyltransferase-like isoleucine patch superfamily enzyme